MRIILGLCEFSRSFVTFLYDGMFCLQKIYGNAAFLLSYFFQC